MPEKRERGCVQSGRDLACEVFVRIEGESGTRGLEENHPFVGSPGGGETETIAVEPEGLFEIADSEGDQTDARFHLESPFLSRIRRS